MVLTKKETQIPKPKLHILICINSREHFPEPRLNDCMTQNFQKEDLNELRNWLKEQKLILKVKITTTNCLGMCSKEGSICMIYPEQEYYIFDSIGDLKELIINKL